MISTASNGKREPLLAVHFCQYRSWAMPNLRGVTPLFPKKTDSIPYELDKAVTKAMRGIGNQ